MAAANLIDVECWVMIDASGNYEIAPDQDTLKTRYEESIGEIGAEPVRVVKVLLKVPAPKVVEVTAVIPEEEEVGELVVR